MTERFRRGSVVYHPSEPTKLYLVDKEENGAVWLTFFVDGAGWFETVDYVPEALKMASISSIQENMPEEMVQRWKSFIALPYDEKEMFVSSTPPALFQIHQTLVITLREGDLLWLQTPEDMPIEAVKRIQKTLEDSLSHLGVANVKAVCCPYPVSVIRRESDEEKA